MSLNKSVPPPFLASAFLVGALLVFLKRILKQTIFFQTFLILTKMENQTENQAAENSSQEFFKKKTSKVFAGIDNKKHCLVIDKQELDDDTALCFYLNSIKLKWNIGNEQHDIPAGLEMQLDGTGEKGGNITFVAYLRTYSGISLISYLPNLKSRKISIAVKADIGRTKNGGKKPPKVFVSYFVETAHGETENFCKMALMSNENKALYTRNDENEAEERTHPAKEISKICELLEIPFFNELNEKQLAKYMLSVFSVEELEQLKAEQTQAVTVQIDNTAPTPPDTVLGEVKESPAPTTRKKGKEDLPF